MGAILILLAVYAGTIMLLYSVYVANILIGKASRFELSLMDYYLQWVVANGQNSRGKMWLMILCSFFIEFAYLFLALYLIDNSTLIFLSIFLLTFELLHAGSVVLAFRQFFKNERPFKNLFNWRLERTSALFLFTHTLLVLSNIFFFQGFL